MISRNYLRNGLHVTLYLVVFILCLYPVKAQWQQIALPDGSKVRSFAVKGTNLYAGTDTGGVFVSNNSGLNWTASSSGLVEKGIVALLVKDSLIVAGLGNGFGGATYLSTDNGASWNPSTSPYYGYLFCLALRGTDILGGTWYGVIKSVNNGSSWTTLPTTGLPSNAGVSAIAQIGTTIFAGVSSSSVGNTGVFISTNGGNSWSEKNTGLVNLTVRALVAKDSTLFVATPSGVSISTNNGGSWTTANTGLTSAVNCFKVRGNRILAGTLDGIFMFADSSKEWISISDNITSFTSITAIESMGGYLYVGAKGEIWRRPVAEVISGVGEMSPGILGMEVHPNPSSGSVVVSLSQSDEIKTIVAMNTLGQLVYQSAVREGSTEVEMDLSNLEKGIYFIMAQTMNGALASGKVILE